MNMEVGTLPREIRPEQLDQLVKLDEQRLEAAVVRTQAQNDEATAKDRFERAIWDLQYRIAKGTGTTGDHLLDLNMMVFGSPQKDTTYQRLNEFEQLLQEHSGELVCWSSTGLDSSRLGVLPENPLLSCKMPEAYVSQGVKHMHKRPQAVRVPLALRNEYQLVREESYLELSEFYFKHLNQTQLLFEAEIQKEFTQIDNEHIAYGLWVASRRLGHPLRPSKMLAGVIRDKRENLAVELQFAISGVYQAQKAFEQAQGDRGTMAKLHGKDIHPTSTGVELVFRSEVCEVRKAITRLGEAVKQATELGMLDPDTLNKGAVAAESLLNQMNERWAEVDI